MLNNYSLKNRPAWCLLCLFILGVLESNAQDVYADARGVRQQQVDSRDQYKPVVEVLNEMMVHYDISFLYEPAALEGKKVVTDFTYKGKVEHTLSRVLEPVGLTFKRINSKTYSILPKSEAKSVNKNQLKANLSNIPSAEADIEYASMEDEVVATGSSSAQLFPVTGVITDDTNNPLPGVNVLIKGTTSGTTADVDGRFNLDVPDQSAVLVISFIGYVTQEVAVGSQTTINVTLAPDVKQLGEVVVVGYGTQKRATVTGAIASVSSEEIAVQPVVNVGQALQGRVAGVTVVNNGAPGSAPIVRIRGVGTVNNANPLYVVDGFPTSDLNSINPKDIESLDVLKDASAAAIYGSRAANGVILITTKRGSNKKISVNLDSYYGVQQVWKQLDLLNTAQYIPFATELLANSGQEIPPRIVSGLDQPIYAGTSQTFRQTNTDWQDEMFRTAPIQQHKVEIGGGNEKSRMFSSFGYFDQEGTMLGTGYRRGDARFNSDHEINKRISFGQNFYVAYDERKVEQNSGGRTQLQHMFRSSPYFPVYNPNNFGGFFGAQGVDASDPENPVRIATMDRQNQQRLKFLGNAYVNVKLFDFLSYRFQGGLDYSEYTQRTHLPAFSTNGYSNRANANVNQNRQNFASVILTNQLSFNKTFDKHTVNATAIAEQQTFTFTQVTGQGNNTQSNVVQEPVALAEVSFNGNRDESALISYVARVNYDYANKYLFGASIRRDGSSRFREGNKWGTFPAVSAGWRISEETFMSGNNLISDLKLRGSYGLAGNFLTPGVYDYQTTISGNQIYQFDRASANPSIGYTIRALSNPDIKWETSRMANVGLDLGLLNNKITVAAEYFNTTTSDMILPRPIPLTYGYDTPPTANVGEVQNKGFELMVGYNKNEGDFTFNASGNISVVRNEVLDLGDEGTTISSGDWYGDNLSRTEVGQPIGYFYGWVTDGIFRDAGEIAAADAADGDASTKYQDNAAPGDIRFKDLNRDGVINAADKTNIGHFLPDFSYGINFSANWKGFDASLFLQGVSGSEIYSVVKYDLEGMTRLFNASTAVLDRWTPENTNTSIPRAISGDPNRNARASDRFIEDGSYFRVKNLTIGYNFSNAMLSSLTKNSLTKLRLYLTTQNLLTLTKYDSGYDPEIGNRNEDNMQAALTTRLTQGIDYGQYPQPRTIIVGLQVGF